MKGYAQLRSRFWTHGTGKALRGDPKAQLVALYLISAPQADMVGIFHSPVIYMAHETGLTEADVLHGLERLQAEGFLVYDHDNEDVWVCSMAKEQIGDTLKPGDKRRSAIEKQLQTFIRSPLLPVWLERYGESYGITIDVSPFEAPSKPHAGTPDAPSKPHSAAAVAVVDAELKNQNRSAGKPPLPPVGGQAPEQPRLGFEDPPSPPPKPKPKRQRGERPAWEGYAAAYAEGMTEAAGQPFAAPRQRADLVQMATTFALGRDGSKLTGDELVAWFRSTAAEYRRRTEPRFERYDPAGCLRWLNAGRPDKRDRPPAARGAPNVQPAPATGSIYDCEEF